MKMNMGAELTAIAIGALPRAGAAEDELSERHIELLLYVRRPILCSISMRL